MSNSKLELKPKDSYRGVETLCREFPEKTAKEIMELHEHDKKCHQLWIEKGQEKARAFAKKINDAGAIYYKGRFGLDQRYFYKVSNAEVSKEGEIYADFEKIIVFMGDDGLGGKIEKINKGHTSLKNYSLNFEKETTKEDWDEISAYFESIKKFWDDIEWNM